MASLTITKTKESMTGIFNKISRIFYTSTPNLTPATLTKFDCELPVLSDGVNFDTGEADVTVVKLTDGTNWTSIANPGDPDISFQVASFDDAVTSIFLTKKTSAAAATSGALAEDANMKYSGSGFSLTPKTIHGGLFLVSEDRQVSIFMPNVEAYSSVAMDGDNPGYFNVKVTPKPSTGDGSAIYILSLTNAS